jgi:predicted aspartyl protease
VKGVAMALAFVGFVPSVWAADSLPAIDQIYLAEQAGRTDEAQRMIAQVLAAHPNSAKAHYVQAEVYARAGKMALARTGGVLVAPVVVNNFMKLNFLVDSGASDVSIPSDVFSSLLRSGAIAQTDAAVNNINSCIKRRKES